jgi:hypothetical protein
MAIAMNFNNENIDRQIYGRLIKSLNDKVKDGEEIFIYERNYLPLSNIIETESDFMITLEQLLINEQLDLDPDTFDLNREEDFNLLVSFINELEIVKFSYNNVIYFSINDVFLKNITRDNPNLHEHQIVSKILTQPQVWLSS